MKPQTKKNRKTAQPWPPYDNTRRQSKREDWETDKKKKNKMKEKDSIVEKDPPTLDNDKK